MSYDSLSKEAFEEVYVKTSFEKEEQRPDFLALRKAKNIPFIQRGAVRYRGLKESEKLRAFARNWQVVVVYYHDLIDNLKSIRRTVKGSELSLSQMAQMASLLSQLEFEEYKLMKSDDWSRLE